MGRNPKTANARELRSWQERAGPDVRSDDSVGATHPTPSTRRKGSAVAITSRVGTRTDGIPSIRRDAAMDPAVLAPALSIRAENVLKELATDLTGECPPRGRWIPPERLLRNLTLRELQTARNC